MRNPITVFMFLIFSTAGVHAGICNTGRLSEGGTFLKYEYGFARVLMQMLVQIGWTTDGCGTAIRPKMG